MDLKDFESTTTYAIEAVYRSYWELIPEKYKLKEKLQRWEHGSYPTEYYENPEYGVKPQLKRVQGPLTPEKVEQEYSNYGVDDEYSKYMTETPILEGVANREYYGRSATSIENKSTIEYGTEQGLAALIYGEQGVSSLPIQDIRGEYIDTDNEYMYYYSVEFIK